MKDALAKALVAWENSTVIFERMAQVELTPEQGFNILANLQAQRILSDKMRENIGAIWQSPTHAEDSARNLYNLYNALTQHVTHDIAGERFELASRVNENALTILERASRDAGKLAKLISALPVVTVSPEQL